MRQFALQARAKPRLINPVTDMGIEVTIWAFGRAKRPMNVKRYRFHAGLLRYSSFTPEAYAKRHPKLLERFPFTFVHGTLPKPLFDRIFLVAKWFNSA
jgi:hypothetical protein